MHKLMILLAQTTPASNPAGTPPSPGPFGGGSMLIPIVLAMLAFWWVMSRGQRKKQQEFAQMLANLKRNDRVQTIGGIIGTVVDVREDEVVLKVDETNNVKMRFTRGAIKEIMREPGTGEAKS